jgi:integrase
VQLRKTIGNTKTRSSVRTIELTMDTVERLKVIRPKKGGDLLFPSPKDSTLPMSPATVWDAFRRYMLYLGMTKPGPKGSVVPKITFHGLRHTFATLMLAGVPASTPGCEPMHGLSPNVVAEMLGHSTTALLWQTYAHVIPPTEGQAAHLLDAQLSQRDKARAEHAKR